MTTVPEFNRVAIIGVGLIGGSLARALRANHMARHIVGCGRKLEHLELARELGVVDSITTDPAVAVDGADMVLVAVPVGAMHAVLSAIRRALGANAIVTDAGSTKVSVINAARDALGDAMHQFVPGHPVAGTEQSGVAASFSELFQNRRVILTPTEQTNVQATECVRQMWQAVGAQVCEMAAEHHDEVLAATSHLPHLLAYTLVDSLARMQKRREIFEYAAGGFADFTRIASSSPEMWTDIVCANEPALLAVLDEYMQDLQGLRSAISDKNRDEIGKRFQRAKDARDNFTASSAERQKP